jgi:putative SOS response-associated peptidase YedK
VILPAAAEAVWLDPKITEPQTLLPLLKPYPSDLMEFYPVSKLVNSPAHDTPDCIVPV